MSISIVWFRNDLRLHDHAPLTQALTLSEKVILVYVFDPDRWRELDLGFHKTGPFQTRFLLESVTDLKEQLKMKGADLVVKTGAPDQVIAGLAKKYHVDAVFTSKEVTPEEVGQEKSLEKELHRMGIPLELCWQSTLYHIDDIPWPIMHLPDIFTHFRKENEKKTPVRKAIPAPAQIPCLETDKTKVPSLSDFGFEITDATPDERSAFCWKGGETAGWDRLQQYFWESDQLKHYKWTRNGLLGADYSSKFSAWLAHGCISPRAIYEEVLRYEEERRKNVSTYWLIFELIWRDYFRFVAKKYGAQIFKKAGIKQSSLKFTDDSEGFQKWIKAETGVPFIDANMRELLLTGFMSNRGRQNVASFLVKDLAVDWRWGAAWFESQLIDYDVCSNWGNWMYVAGVGNDPRENRYFNVMSQASKYDGKGEYVRTWLPELSALSGNRIHAPSELPAHELTAFGLVLGVDYPHPLVDFGKWV